jgi:hypothetical protein
VSGFAAADTATLEIIRSNLLGGLDKVVESLDAGTFHTVGPKGSAPPAQSGHLTLALLDEVEAELERRAVCARES